MRLPPNRQDISCMTSKKLPNVYKKWSNTDFTRKMKYFDTPLTYCLKMWQFGQNNCCHRLRKVAQSAMNRPIWSHWTSATSLSIRINTFLHWSIVSFVGLRIRHPARERWRRCRHLWISPRRLRLWSKDLQLSEADQRRHDHHSKTLYSSTFSWPHKRFYFGPLEQLISDSKS